MGRKKRKTSGFTKLWEERRGRLADLASCGERIEDRRISLVLQRKKKKIVNLPICGEKEEDYRI